MSELDQKKVDILSRLLRELEAEIGTRDVALLVFRALKVSADIFCTKNCDKNGKFLEQFEELCEVISNTKPKFGILNMNFTKILHHLQNVLEGNPKSVNCQHIVMKEIDKILKKARGCKANLIKNSEKIDVEGKTILIHDHSHTVQDVLVNYKRMGKRFRVVIAEQDFEKTHSNIESMHKAKIPFQVVPAYMLSHVHEEIDMLFFGALTLKDTMHYVMDPGTHGIISEFHVVNTPVYMFIETGKFSLWKSKHRSEVFMHKHSKKHHKKAIEYSRIKYSHDRVPSNLFAKSVTDEGVFKYDQLKELYLKKFEENKEFN